MEAVGLSWFGAFSGIVVDEEIEGVSELVDVGSWVDDMASFEAAGRLDGLMFELVGKDVC